MLNNWLNKDSLERLLSIIQNEYIQKRVSESTHPQSIAVNQEIYIPLSAEDILTNENLDSTSMPTLGDDVFLNKPKVRMYSYDSSEYVKVRLMMKNDHEKLNWKLGEVIDPLSKPTDYDAIIIHVHGGGFITGSSSESQKSLTHFAYIDSEINNGYPVFSVDYRLAPKYKFPAGLNDLWQTYCWLVLYAETYLKIRFKKTIMVADSAGGNLVLGLIILCIRRKFRKPDGFVAIYPSTSVNKSTFAPSALYSLDDTFLTTSFIYLCCEYYLKDSKIDLKNYYLCPLFAPDEILREFPPMRWFIAGLDPLRDHQYRFLHKIAKLDVDINIKVMEFRYLMHTWISHGHAPFSLKEAKKFNIHIIKALKELIQLK